jgi:hypothetical protein
MSNERIIGRIVAAVAAACAITSSVGCHRRQAAIVMASAPAGLDSIGINRWLSQQRAACRGHLVTLFDQGAIVGVQCEP